MGADNPSASCHLGVFVDQPAETIDPVEAVLRVYALISHESHGTELAALLHRGEHIARAERQLSDFIQDLVAEGAATSDLRDDVAPEALACYCLHALTAASSLPSKAAVAGSSRSRWLGCAPRAESFCCHWSRKFSTLRCGTVSLFSAGPLSLRLRTAATPPDTAVVTAKVSV